MLVKIVKPKGYTPIVSTIENGFAIVKQELDRGNKVAKTTIETDRFNSNYDTIEYFFDKIGSINFYRKGSYFITKGLILQRIIVPSNYQFIPILVLCTNDETGELTGFIDNEWASNNISHFKYAKHGIFLAGVKRNGYKLISSEEMRNMFMSSLKLKMSDLLPQGQLENSTNFLNFLREAKVKKEDPVVEVVATPTPKPKTMKSRSTKVTNLEEWNNFFSNLDASNPGSIEGATVVVEHNPTVDEVVERIRRNYERYAEQFNDRINTVTQIVTPSTSTVGTEEVQELSALDIDLDREIQELIG